VVGAKRETSSAIGCDRLRTEEGLSEANNQFFTNPIHYANEGEAMRIVLAATGLLLVVGMGGAYAVMHGQPALRNAPNVAAKGPGIPPAESARLFLLSGVSYSTA
jgi:hypothetical protein